MTGGNSARFFSDMTHRTLFIYQQQGDQKLKFLEFLLLLMDKYLTGGENLSL